MPPPVQWMRTATIQSLVQQTLVIMLDCAMRTVKTLGHPVGQLMVVAVQAVATRKIQIVLMSVETRIVLAAQRERTATPAQKIASVAAEPVTPAGKEYVTESAIRKRKIKPVLIVPLLTAVGTMSVKATRMSQTVL